jgi:hypothetical protein
VAEQPQVGSADQVAQACLLWRSRKIVSHQGLANLMRGNFAPAIHNACCCHDCWRANHPLQTGTSMADLFDNPMGLMGFEFVEFASPTPNTLEPLFEKLGFTLVAKHRSKDVVLYRQGGINFIVNREPKSAQVLRRRTRPVRLRPGFPREGRAQGLCGRSNSARSRWRCRPGRWNCACLPSKGSAARRCT